VPNEAELKLIFRTLKEIIELVELLIKQIKLLFVNELHIVEKFIRFFLNAIAIKAIDRIKNHPKLTQKSSIMQDVY
jgi:hypothetical protein